MTFIPNEKTVVPVAQLPIALSEIHMEGLGVNHPLAGWEGTFAEIPRIRISARYGEVSIVSTLARA